MSIIYKFYLKKSNLYEFFLLKNIKFFITILDIEFFIIIQLKFHNNTIKIKHMEGLL